MNKRNHSLFLMAGFLTVGVIPGWDKGIIMLRFIGSVTGLALLMVGCGGGGGGGTSGGGTGGTMSAPSGLQYGGDIVAEVGNPYGPYPPTVTGTVTTYTVSPVLPAGLTLDPSTGAISGTPLKGAPETTYTITASNEAGATTIALKVAILVPPTALTYAGPVTLRVGTALTPVVPSFSGDADLFFPTLGLPPGLGLDPNTGILSGTPSRARVATTYIVTASNAGGAYTTTALTLAVDPPPAGTAVAGVFRSDTVIGLGYVSGTHSGLTDKSGAFTYEQGRGITFSIGAVSIGTVPTAKALVTPQDLVAQGTGTSNRVLNVERFLMMLDQDANANNGIQISAAVTAAAASWAPVDFDTADLPTALGPIIQQASTADGVSHVLPDAATAQAHLRTAFYCTRSGRYEGTYGTDSAPGTRGDFYAFVLPDGSMHSLARDTLLGFDVQTPTGFDVQTDAAVSPLLIDGTFAQSAASPSVHLHGSFADEPFLSGTYLADAAGNFQAVGDASVAATYKFFTITPGGSTTCCSDPISLVMDDSNQVSSVENSVADVVSGLGGEVSGNTFTGSVPDRNSHGRCPYDGCYIPVSGTYSNTAAGITLDGHYSAGGSVVTFSVVGCRAN
jgi:Putative Ig domain